MANIKISELNTKGSLTGNEVFPISYKANEASSYESYKVSISQIYDYLINTNKLSPETLGFGVGTCSVPSVSSTSLTVTLPNYKLVKNGLVMVTFTGYNVAAGASLNINSQGAKAIYFNNSPITSNVITPNMSVLFGYDGTHYVMLAATGGGGGGGVTEKLGFGIGVCDTPAITVEKKVNISNYEIVTGGIVSVRFTYPNTAVNATLNVNSKGAKDIYYKGSPISTTLIRANDIVVMQYNGTQYDIIGIDSAPLYTETSEGSNFYIMEM